MHPSTVNALINLGTVMKDLHLYEEAIIVLEKAINGRRENEGEDSINLAMTKAMAAGAYRDAGKFEQADQYLKDAYTKVAMEYGEENVTASAILSSQGVLYKKMQKYDRSLDSFMRALEIRIKYFGDSHPETCSTR